MKAYCEIVVFDLDGTLLNGDSTSVWIFETIIKSPIRAFIAIVALPIIVPMLFFLKFRHRAASFMLLLATRGMSQPELMLSFEAFAQRLASKNTKLNWRYSGLKALKQYQKEGFKTVIVTASPKLLASALFKAIDCELDVVGSTLKVRNGGWVGDFHCSHEAKCARLNELGFGSHWAAVYTDSLDDLPLLKQATRPIIVNCQRKSVHRKLRQAVPNYESVIWET